MLAFSLFHVEFAALHWQRVTGVGLSSSAADLHFKYNIMQTNFGGSKPKLHLKYPRCMWNRLKRLSWPGHLVRKGCAVFSARGSFTILFYDIFFLLSFCISSLVRLFFGCALALHTLTQFVGSIFSFCSRSFNSAQLSFGALYLVFGTNCWLHSA